jgi:hypothetical protein
VSTDVESGQRCCLTDSERHRILRRLHAFFAWVGVRIPEELDMDGERVQLRERVDRFVFDDYIDDQERVEVMALIDKLESESEILEEELEEEDMTHEEAETLLRRAIGVLRAIDELKHLEDKDVWEDRRRQLMEKVDDAGRWRDFAKRVYYRDEYY